MADKRSDLFASRHVPKLYGFVEAPDGESLPVRRKRHGREQTDIAAFRCQATGQPWSRNRDERR
jgi:hypothetical protein